MQAKEYGRALLDFKNAVQVMPKDAEPYYQLGLSYLANGDVRSAYACFLKATQLNPNHTGAQLKKAELMVALGNKKMVEQGMQSASGIAAKSKDAEAFDTLAMAQLRLGNREDAEKVLEEALKKFPSSLNSSVALAKVKLATKDMQGAENVLQQAITSNPKSPHPHDALGGLYLAERRTPDAEQQFQAALNLDPKDAAALINLGAIQLQTGRLSDADRTYARLSALPDKQYKPLHALFLLRIGKQDAAIAELEKLARQDPSDRTAEARLVTAYMLDHRMADAERVLNASLRKNPKNVDALLLRGRLYIMTGQADKAKTDLSMAISYRNESPDAHYLLGKVYALKHDTTQQQEQYSEALRLNAAFLPARIAQAQLLLATNGAQSALNLLDDAPKAQQQLPAVLVERAWALVALRRTDDARNALAPVLAAGRPPEAVIVDASIRFDSEDYTGARADAEELLRTRPDDLRALDILIRSYAAEKQVPAGIQALRSYTARAPKSAPVQTLLGNALLASGDKTGARAAFAVAVADDPSYHPAQINLAQIEISDGQIAQARTALQPLAAAGDVPSTLILADLDSRSGKVDSAIAGYRKVLAQNPNNPVALNNLAYLLIDRPQNLDEGLQLAQHAQQLAPDNPVFNDTLGWAYFRKGDYPSALSYLSRIAGKETSAEQKYHLAIAYIKTGNAAKGQQLLQAALKADPKLAETQQVSSDLR
jgi:tetratricopeptide (TPR) repeat protein